MYTYLISLGFLDGFKLFFIATALSIQFRLIKSLDFSLATAFTLGGYIAYEFSKIHDISLCWLPFVTIPVIIIFGIILDISIFWPLELSKATSLVYLATSIGFFFAASGFFQLFWGTEIISIQSGPSLTINLFKINFTYIQLTTFLIHTFGTILLVLILHFTKIGQQIRATGENLSLMEALGFNIRKIRLISISLTYGALGLAGAASGIEFGVNSGSGLPIFLSAAVVMIVGGGIHTGKFFIAAIGLGLINNLSLSFIGNQWQQVITFSLLIIYTIYSISKYKYPEIIK